MSVATEIVEQFLDLTIRDLASLAELFAEEVVIEMPFAAPLFPTQRTTTREELRSQFARSSGRTYTRIDNARIHESSDPDVAIVEYDLRGTVNESGRGFSLSYIQVITVKDGLIVHSRDYNNIVQAAQAFGMEKQLVDALAQP
jgi:ketosteroid isomerase-like protein